MGDLIGAIAATMQHDMDRLSMVSRNLANAATVGYRAEVPASNFLHVLSDVSEASRTELYALRDHHPGALQRTGRSLDVALTGAGFFEVSTPDGTRYTRRGDFRLDEAGRLVTSEGFPVMGSGGQIYVHRDDIRIDSSGAIYADGDLMLARLTTVQLDDSIGQALVYEGNGLFRLDSTSAMLQDGTSPLRQGFLESSNVNPMTEITRLMETTRHFSASAQALRAYDEMLGSAIDELGSTS